MANKSFVHEQFKTIYEAYLSGEELWNLRANAAFYNILYSIYTNKAIDKKTVSRKHYQVNRMVEFIENNYASDISSKDVCAQGIYSPDYSGKLFREITGKNVSEYLQNYRLTKAEELFLNIELSVAEVAYMSGFNSDSYFSSVVKSKYNMTPSKLRVKLLNEQVNKDSIIFGEKI